MEVVESGCAPDLLTPSAPGDDRDITLLMILCCQPAGDDGPGGLGGGGQKAGGHGRHSMASLMPQTEAHTRQLLHILAVILVALSTKPETIFVRNHQEASALELTALSNKVGF